MNIQNLYQLANVLRAGPYAWPGGYPKYFIMQDGEACCFECIDINRVVVFAAAPITDEGPETNHPSPDPQWWPVGVEVNWEDPAMYCAHCEGRIESAYADDQVGVA